MRSKDKIHVKVKRIDTADGSKLWAVVQNPKTGEDVLVPSFEDLFRIILAIVHCENRKYWYLKRPPSDMVRSFLVACVHEADAGELPLSAEAYEAAWARLDGEFQITEGRAKQRAASDAGDAAATDCPPDCACELCREWPKGTGTA